MSGSIFEIDYGNRQIRHDMILIEAGDRLMVTISSMPDGSTTAYFTDFYRRNSLLSLLGIFILGSVVISGWKGVKSLVGIMLSLAVIILIILPGIQEGRDPLSVSILGSFLFVGFSLYLVYGWNAKTHAAVLGSFIALSFTGVLALIFVTNTRLTGYGDENMFYISQLTQNTLEYQEFIAGRSINRYFRCVG